MRLLLTAAAATVACVAGCSSQPPVETRPGTLLIGTARVTIDDVDTVYTDQVACTVAGPLTTITTGTAASGLTALVSNDGTLNAQSVSIRNLGGFTGNYHGGLGNEAQVTVTGRSYTISGHADGFTTSAPAIQTSGTFTIDVAC